MAFRTVTVSNRCKLELRLGYLVCRKENDEIKVLLDEIKLLIIDSTLVNMSSALIVELMKRKIKVIYCDEKHNPYGELTPYENNYYTYRKIKEQMEIPQDAKNYLWKEIVKEKILNQARNLKYAELEEPFELLCSYANELQLGDSSNREGHAAKVYFNALFGKDFSRDNKENVFNKYLNYGYSIILSSINREVKALGYLTELGIHHIGESNPFNISCDLMEPLRPLIDSLIIKGEIDEDNYRTKLVGVLQILVNYNGTEMFLDNAIRLYVEDLFNYLNTGDIEKIRFIHYEL